MTRPTACYVVGCPTPCDHAKVAETRRPEWGDIVAPPDWIYLCPEDDMGMCARAQYTRKEDQP